MEWIIYKEEKREFSDMKWNSVLHHPRGANNDKNPKGMFREFNDVLRNAIVKVVMRDATITRESNSNGLTLQA